VFFLTTVKLVESPLWQTGFVAWNLYTITAGPELFCKHDVNFKKVRMSPKLNLETGVLRSNDLMHTLMLTAFHLILILPLYSFGTEYDRGSIPGR
jgi:hypothetical protein